MPPPPISTTQTIQTFEVFATCFLIRRCRVNFLEYVSSLNQQNVQSSTNKSLPTPSLSKYEVV